MAHFNFLRNSTITHKNQPVKEKSRETEGKFITWKSHFSLGREVRGEASLFSENIYCSIFILIRKKKKNETLRVITCAVLFLTTLVSHP